MTTQRSRLGKDGETLARSYLESIGYIYVDANWRKRSGELDLVMRDGTTLVFVEVKTRHGDSAGRAEESISLAQGRRVLNTAELFVYEHPDLQCSAWRVDLVAITYERSGQNPRITHWPDAVVTG